MKPRHKIAVLGLVLVVALPIGWWGVNRFYLNRLRTLDAGITRLEKELPERQDKVRALDWVRPELLAFAETTLAPDNESATADARKAMNQIVERMGLRDASISTSPVRLQESPVAGKMKELAAFRDDDGRLDFRRFSITLDAAGSLEQVMRTLALLEAQPWVHRIDRVAVEPADEKASVFKLGITAWTIILPGAENTIRSTGRPLVVEPDGGLRHRYDAVLAKNVFREPDPPKPEPQQPQPAPVAQSDPAPEAAPPAPPPPWEEWKVTGIVAGQTGQEVWMLNTRTQELRRLSSGDTVLEARLEQLQGEWATFRIADALYRVQVGRTLADRTAATQ